MDFVNKKDFEAALKVILAAIKNGQVVEGYVREGQDQPAMNKLLFGVGDFEDFAISHEKVMFLPPEHAAKKKLHNVQNELKIKKETFNKSQSDLQSLEQEEESLRKLLPTLKEK